MLVVDASAVVETLITPATSLVGRLNEADELAAPELIDLEVLQALRRMVRRTEVNIDRATDARNDFADLNVTRLPHEPLIVRIWELRDNLSAYDAAYVALAELISVPLVTCDSALAGVPGVRAEIELYDPA